MKADAPLVSVIIPVHNGDRYLAEAIDSVLEQRYRPLEVIVVDDGSTDHSGEIARSYGPPVAVHRRPQGGTAAARNTGLQLADGAYLAHLDADDLWTEGRLARQIEAFREHPDADIVSGRLRQFFSPDIDEHSRARIGNQTNEMPGHHLGAMLVARRAQDIVGPFDHGWKIGQDMDWYLRAVVEIGLEMVMLPELVLLRRLHDSNKGITHREFAAQRMEILRASLERRRAPKCGGTGSRTRDRGSGG
jgi:glycosyltransferase involved in cell wall biosynthesis